jgi:hypothetical protein
MLVATNKSDSLNYSLRYSITTAIMLVEKNYLNKTLVRGAKLSQHVNKTGSRGD